MKKKKRDFKKFVIPIVIFLILAFSIALFLKPETKEDEVSKYINKKEFLLFDDNFHAEQTADIKYRWVSNNATMTLVIPYDQIIKIKFVSWSYRSDRTLNLYLEDYPLAEIELTKERKNYESPFIYLKRGVYKLRFLMDKECETPALVEKSGDTRCLSISVGNFEKIEISDIITHFNETGWYKLENYFDSNMRWINQTALMTLLTLEKRDYTLEFFTFSFYFDRVLKIYVDGELIDNFKITSNGSEIKVRIPLDKGLHLFKFDGGGCDIPQNLGISRDTRCLSIAIVRPLIY